MINKLKKIIYRLLRKSEKYTKTDMVYLAKGGFWLTLGQFISSISSFLLAIAFANLLPKEVYGNYKYILSVISILSIPTLSGMNTAITQAVARGFEKSFVPALMIKIKWGVLGSIASLIISLYYFINDDNLLSISFLISSIFLPFMESLTLYSAYLTGKKQFKIITEYNILARTINIIVIIITIYLTDNLLILVPIYLISNTTIRFIFLKLTIGKFSVKQEEDPTTMSYGKHLSLMGIMNALAGQLDKVLVFQYLGAVDLAIYFFATSIPEYIKGLFVNINILALPKLSSKSTIEIKKYIFKKIALLSLFAGFIMVIYIILAPLIFNLLFPQYIESIFYSQIFSISIILFPITGLAITALQSQKARKELYKFNIYFPLFQIVALFIAIQFYGLIGVIIARVIVRLFGSIIATILLKTLRK